MHSAYNVTISDFRAHATIASTRSGRLPAKVTDLVFERRGSHRNREGSSSAMTYTPATTSASAPSTPYVAATGAPVSDPFNVTMNLASSNATSASASVSAGGTSALASHSINNGFVASLYSLSTPSPLVVPPPRTSSSTLPTTLSIAPISPTLGLSTNSSPSWHRQARKMSLGQVSSHGCIDVQDRTSESPKKALKGWGAAAAMKLGFMNMKKKRPLYSHYLSLPVGGTTAPSSVGTSGMYMLHSEDLSVTEFAKLAGITILPEEDDTVASYEESLMTNSDHNAIEGNQHSTPLEKTSGLQFGGGGEGGSAGGASRRGSAGNTLSSDKNLTLGSSTSSSESVRRNSKANIWDPQFWVPPLAKVDESFQSAHPSTSSVSLPLQPPSANTLIFNTTRAADIPSRSGFIQTSIHPLQEHSPSGSAAIYPSKAASEGPSETSLGRIGIATGALQPRRHSCSPFGSQSAASPRCSLDVPHAMSTSSGVSLKRVDPKMKTSNNNEAIQLSLNLGRRRSFSSLTAIAIELDSDDHDLDGDVSSVTQSSKLKNQERSSLCPTKVIKDTIPIAIAIVTPDRDVRFGRRGFTTRRERRGALDLI
ncbi:hypothetical protein BGX28_005003 [Mortierella sp. GBA30]|nr:hypothetical protein BGX28_005003 [Mortierella sp. GBA30]